MSNSTDKKQATFHYIKADNFHSVLTTGVIGGITVNSLIDVNFYTDRVTIPQSLTYNVENNGLIKDEINRQSKGGSVREIQFGALMDVETAKSLIKWLNEKIEVIESTTIKK